MLTQGNAKAKVLIISDCPGPDEQAEGKVLAGAKLAIFEGAFLRAGLGPEDYCLVQIYPQMPYANKPGNLKKEELPAHIAELKKFLQGSEYNLFVALGGLPLRILTGLSGIHKQQLSILKSRIEFGGVKVLPLFHPRELIKSYSDSAYLSLGALKAAAEAKSPAFGIPERKFWLNPTLKDSLTFLDRCLAAREVALDLETGRGQINTVGFSLSPTEAIAIGVLPSAYGPKNFFKLWSKIREVCESCVPKIAQNALYEAQWLSRYGIRLEHVVHDTMWAMKFLHPELKAGLGNVGRVYTPFPYWKDDNESWNNVRDWTQHYEYNCKDTTGTHAAYLAQREDLEERGLASLYYGFVQKFFEPIREMCSRGLLIDQRVKKELTQVAQRKIDRLNDLIKQEVQERTGNEDFNPRSGVQLKKALEEFGMVLPFKIDEDGKRKKSTDKVALCKLRKKHPKEEVLTYLLQLSKQNKLMSSYLDFEYDPDGRVRYSLNAGATETGRWNSTKDSFGKGFNAQTVPKFVRGMFVAEEGKYLVQIDLAQAESRYVAWEAPEAKLMELINSGQDIHKYVASRIFGKPEAKITKRERQLGKKSGHAANYGVGPRTFAEQCLLDGIDISEKEAKRIIEGYHEVFPGIRRRQAGIIAELRRCRKLKTPIGRERTFYGRLNDGTFREAFAFAPQSVIPDITNALMLYLADYPEYEFLLQVHDSLLIQVLEKDIQSLVDRARDQEAWHPVIDLPGGRLVIPVDIELGKTWGEMDAV